MSPRVHRVFLPLFLAFYCAAGFLGHSAVLGRDLFPFFAWGLYADAAPTETQYTARLLEIDGRLLSKPIDLMEAPGFHRAPDYWRDAGVVTRFGAALDRGDRETAEALRRLFEMNILMEDRVRYEMVKRIYSPLERRASGLFRETSLGSFEKTPDQAGR